jgi:hypothetical protein
VVAGFGDRSGVGKSLLLAEVAPGSPLLCLEGKKFFRRRGRKIKCGIRAASFQ